jgi:hypothetical protein
MQWVDDAGAWGLARAGRRNGWADGLGRLVLHAYPAWLFWCFAACYWLMAAATLAWLWPF